VRVGTLGHVVVRERKNPMFRNSDPVKNLILQRRPIRIAIKFRAMNTNCLDLAGHLSTEFFAPATRDQEIERT
jgi:hypothetical protein